MLKKNKSSLAADANSDSGDDGSPLKRKAPGDSDTENEDATAAPTIQNSENAGNEEILKKKPRSTNKPFTEDMLVSRLGINLIYENFPKTCQLRGRGFEGSDLKKLLTHYAGWAWQLYPGMAFPDMLNRINSLGSKGPVRSCLGSLRDRERDRYLVGRISSSNCISYSNFDCCFIVARSVRN